MLKKSNRENQIDDHQKDISKAFKAFYVRMASLRRHAEGAPSGYLNAYGIVSDTYQAIEKMLSLNCSPGITFEELDNLIIGAYQSDFNRLILEIESLKVEDEKSLQVRIEKFKYAQKIIGLMEEVDFDYDQSTNLQLLQNSILSQKNPKNLDKESEKAA